MLKLGGHDLVQQRVEFAEVGQFVDRLFLRRHLANKG
jgi:hypothetical protein